MTHSLSHINLKYPFPFPQEIISFSEMHDIFEFVLPTMIDLRV